MKEIPDSVIHEPVGDPSPWLWARGAQARKSRRSGWFPPDRVLAAMQWTANLSPLDQQVCWMPGALWRAMKLAHRFRPEVLVTASLADKAGLLQTLDEATA